MKNRTRGIRSLIFCLFLSPFTPNPSHAQPDYIAPIQAPKVQVESSFSPKGSWISSFIVTDKGTRLSHGVQLFIGPNNQVRSLDSHNSGVVEQETRLHSNGTTFRHFKMNRDGIDGYEAIYATDRTAICSGTLKKGQRWNGSFLVKEIVMEDTAEKLNLMIYNFKEGDFISKKPFDMTTLLLPKDSWLADDSEFLEALNGSEVVILQ